MPIVHQTFGCQFKCGRKHSPSEKIIANHEKTCWSNPRLKTCKSCKNQVFEKIEEVHDELPGRPVEVWFERGCLNSKGVELLESEYDKLITTTGYIKPMVNCPYWNQGVPELEEDGSCIKSREKREDSTSQLIF